MRHENNVNFCLSDVFTSKVTNGTSSNTLGSRRGVAFFSTLEGNQVEELRTNEQYCRPLQQKTAQRQECD
jgi:hypothetical protein